MGTYNLLDEVQGALMEEKLASENLPKSYRGRLTKKRMGFQAIPMRAPLH
jgi:hypothetical protein